MNRDDYVALLSSLAPDGEQKLQAHIADFGEILPHVLAEELLTGPLLQHLQNADRRAALSYCNVIETMWNTGDEEIRNVVWVTVLERLTDVPELWQRFGCCISRQFLQFINTEYPLQNTWLGDIQKLSYRPEPF